MKKKYLYFLLLFLTVTQIFAQSDFDLVKIFNINGNVYTHEKIWMQNNKFLVPISFNTQNYTLESGVIINNPNYQVGQNSFKMLIAQYGENGQLLSHFTLNSTGFELLQDVKVDKNDNIYLTYAVSAGYQLEGQTYFSNVPESVTKYMMIKMSKGGIILWKKTFEDGGLMMFNLAVANNGDVFMTARAGQQNIKVDGITYTNPTPHQTQTSLTRMVVGKLNTNGNGMHWMSSSTNSVTEAFANIFVFNNRQQVIRVDSQNNVYLLGNLWGMKTTFGSTTLQNIGLNKEKLFLVKYNSNGQFQWVKSPTIPNNSLHLTPYQFEIDQQDNLFLLEQYHPGFNGNETVNYWGTNYTTNKAISSLIKLNTSGDIQWIKKPQALQSGNSYQCNLIYFAIVNEKILAFGIFNGSFDYGNGVQINTGGVNKWISIEFNKDGGVDNYNILDSSFVLSPFNFIGMDSQKKLWFAQKTATVGTFNLFIGTLNYNFTIGNSNQKLVYFRSGMVLLNNEEFQKLDFSIYPNPTQDVINIAGDDLLNKNYQIYDLTGKIVMHGKLNNNKINVEILNTGTYMLKIFNDNNTYINNTVKFVKK